MAEQLRVQVAHVTLYVPADDVTSLVVCERSGQVPFDCGLSACENGCPEVELTFVRAEVLSDAFSGEQNDG